MAKNQESEKNIIATMVSIETPLEELAILEKIAKEKGININQLVTSIIREKIAERDGENLTFEENGVIYERLMLDIPKAIADFYRCKAFVQGKQELVETFISLDVCQKVKDEIDNCTPETWREMFNLGPVFTDMGKKASSLS